MSARFSLAALVFGLCAGLLVPVCSPAAPVADPPAKDAKGAKPAGPTVVLQLQPVNRLVTDLKELIRLAAGPADGEAAVRRFLKDLEDVLGEKGFEGLDIGRPAAAYATAREKFEDSTLVLVVPYTTEAEFLGLLERLKFKAEPVEGKKGVFKLTPPEDSPFLPDFDHDSYLRLADGWAYVGLNGDEVLDPAKLLPTAELFDPQETAQVAVRVYPGRFPEKLLKDALTDFENTVDQFKMFLLPDEPKHVNKGLNDIVSHALKLIRRAGETLQKDAQQVKARYAADPLTGDITLELTLTPRPGSALAKDVAALKPAPNRFAGLVGKDAAFGVTGRLPCSVPEVRDIAVSLCEMLDAEGNASLPEALRPVSAELFKGLARAAKKGDADFAAAVVGPGKDGRFTAVGAVAFDDPGAVEKALREGVKNALLRTVLKLDADKAGGLAVHTLAVGSFLDPDVQKVFGKEAVVCLAPGKGAAYVSFGPEADALAALKAAVAAPAGGAAATYLETAGNPARLARLVAALGNEADGKRVTEVLGKEDKLMPLNGMTVEGGDRLVIRMRDNVKFMFGSAFAEPAPGGVR